MIFPRDTLVAALHHRGICYLAPSPSGDEPVLSDAEMLVGLAGSRDGRLRFATAGLLLVHPELAQTAEHLVASHDLPGVTVPDAAWVELRKQYIAAVYLQRMWRTRLQQTFGPLQDIPERYTTELNLPPAAAMHGEYGLRMLTDNSLFNDWSSYDQVVDMICEQPCSTA
jgi:hypothetical protein